MIEESGKGDKENKEKEYIIPDRYKEYSVDRNKFIEVLTEFVSIHNISELIADYTLSWIYTDILKCLTRVRIFPQTETDESDDDNGYSHADAIKIMNRLKYPNFDDWSFNRLINTLIIVSEDIKTLVVQYNLDEENFEFIKGVAEIEVDEKFTSGNIYKSMKKLADNMLAGMTRIIDCHYLMDSVVNYQCVQFKDDEKIVVRVWITYVQKIE